MGSEGGSLVGETKEEGRRRGRSCCLAGVLRVARLVVLAMVKRGLEKETLLCKKGPGQKCRRERGPEGRWGQEIQGAGTGLNVAHWEDLSWRRARTSLGCRWMKMK